MTQEEKQLLLRDLSARLPYRVVVSFKNSDTREAFNQILDYTLVHMVEYIPYIGGIEIKPYLRPLSSMTEGERNEISKKLNYEFYADDEGALCAEDDRHRVRVDLIEIYIEWLNEHHLDYRGLIPMGLGIDCTGLNIYENEKSI